MVDDNKIHKQKLKASYQPEPKPASFKFSNSAENETTKSTDTADPIHYRQLKSSFEEAKQNLLVSMKQKEDAYSEIQKLRLQIQRLEKVGPTNILSINDFLNLQTISNP